jgi:hypothetical protein
MSSGIDDLIDDIQKSIDKNESQLETIIEEQGEDSKEAKKLEQKINKKSKKLSNVKRSKKRGRKRIKIRTKGTKGTKGVSTGARCYMRYGNAGQLYRICKGPPPPTTKPPAVFVPKITPTAFVAKLMRSNPKIKGYGDLSSSQKQNYHRLAMAQTRENMRENQALNHDEYKVFLAQKRADLRLDREEDRLRKQLAKEEKVIKRKVESKGPTAANPDEIQKYFDTLRDKRFKKESGESFKDNFFDEREARLKKTIDKRNKKSDNKKQEIMFSTLAEEVITRPRFVDGKRKGNVEGDYRTTFLQLTPDVKGSLEDISKDIGIPQNVGVVRTALNKKQLIDNLKKYVKLFKKPPTQADLKKNLPKEFKELNKGEKDKLVKLFDKRTKKLEEDQRAFFTKDFKKKQEGLKKELTEIYDTKASKAIYKYKEAVKKAEAKGLGPKLVNKNVRVIFDGENVKGFGDISELMNIKETIEKVDEIQDDLSTLTKKKKKSRKKSKKKIADMTTKEKEELIQQELKEIEKLKKLADSLGKNKK